MPKVLIVEDDHSMAVALKDGFEFEGFNVCVAKDGLRGLELTREFSPDVMVLDVMLPKLNGLEVCKQLREQGMHFPIIMLSARGQEIDKVLGLKFGADDYLTKPFSFVELAARVEALLRRAQAKWDRVSTFTFGNVTVDFRKHEVRKDGKQIALSAREFRLLEYFINHRDEVIERDTLLDAVWEHDRPPLTRTVDMHVAKLRKKVEDMPNDPRHIITIHRFGYKFVAFDSTD